MSELRLQNSKRVVIPRESLSREEEVRLGRLSQDGDIDARKKIVMAHMGYGQRLAKRMWYGLSHNVQKRTPFRDMEQAVFEGIAHAAQDFDPDKGRFEAFAEWRIRERVQLMLKERSLIVVPPEVRERRGVIKKAADKFRNENGHDASVEELAELIELTPEQIRVARDAFPLDAISLSTPLDRDSESSSTAGDFIQDNSALTGEQVALARVELQEAEETLRLIFQNAKKKLSRDQLKTFHVVFGKAENGEERTLQEAAEILHVNSRQVVEERLRTIQGKLGRSVSLGKRTSTINTLREKIHRLHELLSPFDEPR